jgi:hypothetical protein
MKLTAVLMILLAIVIGVVPLFTDCQSQGRQLTLADGRTVPMKCYWTGQAELTLAAPIFVTGALMAFDKRKENLRNLNVVSAVLGVFVILLPTVLIGVCANPNMICNSIMKPSLILLGSLLVALSVFGIVKSFRMKGVAV